MWLSFYFTVERAVVFAFCQQEENKLDLTSSLHVREMEMKQMNLVRLRKKGRKHLPSATSVFNFSSITVLKCLNRT